MSPMPAMHRFEKLLVNGPLFRLAHRDVGLPAMLRLARKPIEGPLLEIGCGEGATTQGLLRRARVPVTAIDYDADQVARARARLAGQAKVEWGDAAQLSFPDASFATVVEMNSFHHVPDWRAAQREAFRVLRPGGQFLFMDYTAGFFHKAFAGTSLQPGAFTAEEFVQGLADAGFSPVILRGSWVILGRAEKRAT